VFVIPEGSGRIGVLGWDWYDAQPVGSADNGWVSVLSRMMQLCGTSVIPTMTQWGMIVFTVLAGFVAVFYLRRRRRAKS
jgi:hypothetical protein